MVKIFVYGTLKEGFALDGSCTTKRISVVKNVKIDGTLFDLGPFPGIKLNTGGTVIGELHTFRNSSKTLAMMDSIEGYNPKNEENSLFNRRTTDVMNKSGDLEKAYVYEFNFGKYEIEQHIIKTGIWEEEIEKWL